MKSDSLSDSGTKNCFFFLSVPVEILVHCLPTRVGNREGDGS